MKINCVRVAFYAYKAIGYTYTWISITTQLYALPRSIIISSPTQVTFGHSQHDSERFIMCVTAVTSPIGLGSIPPLVLPQ